MGDGPNSSDQFDPYGKWLGIPPENRPPTYFDLLGLSPNVSDRETIEIAARKQKSVVNSFRGGEHENWAARLSYEVDEATICLLNPGMRTSYRRKLIRMRKRLQASPARPPRPPILVAPLSEKRSIYRRVVGEEPGIAREFAGIMAVLTTCFILAFGSSMLLPWASVESESANVAAAGVSESNERATGRDVDTENEQAPPELMPIEKPWTDLLANASLQTDKVSGSWYRSENAYMADASAAPHAALKLDTLEQTYEFECEFEIMRHGQYPGIAVSLPVGETRGQFSFWAPDWFQMKHVPRSAGSPPGKFSPQKRHMGFGNFADGKPLKFGRNDRVRLHFVVDATEPEYKVTVSMNGGKVYDWSGGKEDLWEPYDDLDLWRGQSRSGIIIASANATVTKFYSAQIREK